MKNISERLQKILCNESIRNIIYNTILLSFNSKDKMTDYFELKGSKLPQLLEDIETSIEFINIIQNPTLFIIEKEDSHVEKEISLFVNKCKLSFRHYFNMAEGFVVNPSGLYKYDLLTNKDAKTASLTLTRNDGEFINIAFNKEVFDSLLNFLNEQENTINNIFK
jgi:hypothetical protein